MFIKTNLNLTNLVSEASCPGRLNPCVKLGSIRFVAILNEWGITPIRRGKKKTLAAQICKNIAHIQYRNVFRAQNRRRWGFSIKQKKTANLVVFYYIIPSTKIMVIQLTYRYPWLNITLTHVLQLKIYDNSFFIVVIMTYFNK